MPEWTIDTLYFPTEELTKKEYDEASIDGIFTFEAIISYSTTPDGLNPKYIINNESVCKTNDMHP